MLNVRESAVARGKKLEYLSIALAGAESLAAIPAGLIAGSIALIGFGLDSLIEMVSAGALVWRMSVDANEAVRERIEDIALRIVGVCFLALAAYVAFESARSLMLHEPARRSIFGIIVLVASLVAMWLLTRAKREVAARIGSAAMAADAQQTEFCAYLSAIALIGLGLNAAFGFWWADPLAALAMVPIIGREGLEAVKGEACEHR